MIELHFRPEKKDLWVFSLLLIPFALLVWFLIDHYSAGSRWAWIVAGVVMLTGIAGLVRPESVRWLFVGWMILAFPIGWAISHLVMAILYFGLFWPVGWIARAVGYDPLQLRPSSRESYWLELETEENKEQYFRQF